MEKAVVCNFIGKRGGGPLYANEITLPLHTCLTDEEVAYVIEKYVSIVKEYK